MNRRLCNSRSPQSSLLALLVTCLFGAAALGACSEDSGDSTDDGPSKPAPSEPGSPSAAGGGPSTDGPADSACGDADQACCAGDTCNTWRQVCVEGTCKNCGSAGAVCCTDQDRAPCLGDNACVDGTCQPCGELGQACCLDTDDNVYDVCKIGTVCDPMVAECVSCGATGGLCCEYGACDDDKAECMGYVEDVSAGTCE